MKIGEAGEAFFVFETDDDVPDDLITSPILQPTRPEEEAAAAQIDNATERFGAKPDSEDLPPHSTNLPQGSPEYTGETSQDSLSQETPQEPDFFDLDAKPGTSRRRNRDEERRDANVTPKQTFRQPTFMRRSDSRSTIQQSSSNEESYRSLGLPSPPPSRSHTPEMEEQDKRVDAALKNLSEGAKGPEVEYHHGMRAFNDTVCSYLDAV